MRGAYLAAALCTFLFAGSAAAGPVRFVTEDFAPFNYRSGGQVAGPGADIARAICASLKVECGFEILPLRRAISEIETGDADGVFSLAKTPERAAAMVFSQPFIVTGYGFFMLGGKTDEPASLADLSGFTAAAYGPSGTYAVLEQAKQEQPGLTLVQEVQFETPFRKLLTGRYPDRSAVFANRHVAALWLKTNHIDGIDLALPYGSIGYRFGFSKTSKQAGLADMFDAALSDLKKNGELARIVDNAGFSASDVAK